jgi:hypothetical protein
MSKLRLIDFSPDNFRIADVLSRAHSEVIDASDDLNAAFSLYFQWPDHRSAMISSDGSVFMDCDLSVDSDLAVPEELWISIKRSAKNEVAINLSKPVTVRFEVFRTCFEFVCPVLADITDDSTSAETRLVIAVPRSITMHKARSCPRYEVPASHELQSSVWIDESGTEVPILLADLSVKVLFFNCDQQKISQSGRFSLGRSTFAATVLRRTDQGVAVQPIFKDQREYGLFFDQFIKVAYPDLRPRYDFDHNDIYDLYVRTGYLSRFGTDVGSDQNEELQRRKDLTDYWKSSEEFEHLSKVDYVLVNPEGRPVGASGLAKIFVKDGRDVWAAHQLCVDTKNATYLGTGDLYKWRAEYLSGMSQDIENIVWYRSVSKWIEKMYTKQSIANPSLAILEAIHLKKSLKNEDYSELTFDVKKIDGGRIYFSSESMLAGTCPELLNASKLFEIIWVHSDKVTENEVLDCIKKYNYLAKSSSNTEFRISMPAKLGMLVGLETRPTDRLFTLKSNGFATFLNSVDHSVSLVNKKHNGINQQHVG